MSEYRDQLRRTASKTEAFAEVANILEDIDARLGALESATAVDQGTDEDDVLVWDQPMEERDHPFTAPAITDGIAAVEEQLQKASGDDYTALEARLRILKDELREVKTIEDAVTEVPLVAVRGKDGEVEYELPDVDAGIQAARREYAVTTMQIRNQYPDREELVDAFGKGGPLLFYYTDRDWLMSLPVEMRRWCVEDVGMTSGPQLAREVGRDLLMRADDEADPTIATEHAEQMSHYHRGA